MSPVLLLVETRLKLFFCNGILRLNAAELLLDDCNVNMSINTLARLSRTHPISHIAAGSLPPSLAYFRTAGKNYPPKIQAALGRAHLLYIHGKVVEASTELSRVVVQCASVSDAVLEGMHVTSC